MWKTFSEKGEREKKDVGKINIQYTLKYYKKFFLIIVISRTAIDIII